MKGDILFTCVDKHRFIVSAEDMGIGVDGLSCIECGKWCHALGLATWYPYEGLKRYTRVKAKEPLLTITVQDLDSIPVITYKGEDIQGRVSVSYEWVTKDNRGEGKHDMSIRHYPNTTGTPVLKTIALSRLM